MPEARPGAALVAKLARRTSSGRYIPEADGLRFLAIMLVLLFHASIIYAVATKQYVQHPPFGDAYGHGIPNWMNQSQLGVELFFTLSGFVLVLPFIEGKPTLWRYYRRRLTRLEPPYLVALTIAFLIAPTGMLGHYFAGAAYSHDFFYSRLNPLNSAFWSLEVEVQFYLVMPLIAMVFLMRDKLCRRITIVSAALLASEIAFGVRQSGQASHALAGSLQFFLVGFLLADVYINDWRQSPKSHWLWDVIGVLSLGLILNGHLTPRFVLALPLIGFLLFVAAFRGRVIRLSLANKWVRTIGGMAYSIYLIHLPLMTLLGRDAHDRNLAVWTAFLIIASLLIGLIFYLLIERPCMEPDWPQDLRHLIRCLFVRRASEGSESLAPPLELSGHAVTQPRSQLMESAGTLRSRFMG